MANQVRAGIQSRRTAYETPSWDLLNEAGPTTDIGGHRRSYHSRVDRECAFWLSVGSRLAVFESLESEILPLMLFIYLASALSKQRCHGSQLVYQKLLLPISSPARAITVPTYFDQGALD